MEKICRFPKQGFAPKLMYTYNQKACVGTTHPKKILWKVADLFPCSGLYQGHLSKLVWRVQKVAFHLFSYTPKNRKHQQWEGVSHSVLWIWAGNPLSGMPSFEEVGGYFFIPLSPRIGMVDFGLLRPCSLTLVFCMKLDGMCWTNWWIIDLYKPPCFPESERWSFQGILIMPFGCISVYVWYCSLERWSVYWNINPYFPLSARWILNGTDFAL